MIYKTKGGIEIHFKNLIDSEETFDYNLLRDIHEYSEGE